MFVQNQRVAALINATLSLCLHDAIYHSHLRNREMKLCLLKVSCTFSLFSFQEMYKASKYEVSPDMKLVLLAYNVQPVRPVFIWVLLCVCWDESNQVTMWKGRHTPPPHQNQIHPAGVIETEHTHTHAHTRERRTESVFTLGLTGWSELNFSSNLISLSFHIIFYSVAPNHRGVYMVVGISHRCC